MDFQAIIQDYLDGELTKEQHAELSDWLEQDEANREAFVRASMLDTHIHRQLTQSDLNQFLDQVDIHSLQSALEQSYAGESGAFAAMMDKSPSRNTHKPADEVTLSRAINVLTHAGAQFAGQSLKRHAAPLALAAAVVLAITLFAIFQGDDTPTPGPNTAQVPDAVIKPELNQAVATLTATHNAVWESPQAEGALAPGSQLHPGDHLTLTAGFAEITTNDGAIAILEAPCVVELKDNDNALHLHRGKLVGICETESSKGFLVRTPHMDVIDLGTRFGVDATQPDATEVHVFEGKVQAARSSTEPILLVAEQSARASAGADTITAIDPAPQRFAAIRDESGLGPPNSTTVLDTDTDGTQWLITTSQHAGTTTYAGNRVTCTIDNAGFTRGVAGGNAYGFIQHTVAGAGLGKPATATGAWTFSNLPAGRYDVATAFDPNKNNNSIRYTVNGSKVLVDQSAIPAIDAGPSFADGIGGYSARPGDIQFTMIGSSVVVPQGGTITVTIDNANNATTTQVNMDSVAIRLIPETDQNP